MAKQKPYADMSIEELKNVNIETGKVEKPAKIKQINKKPVKHVIVTHTKPKEKESWVKKLKRTSQQVIHGKNYTKVMKEREAAAKKKAAQKEVDARSKEVAASKTTRTSNYEKQLKASGMSDAEIASLRGKKK